MQPESHLVQLSECSSFIMELQINASEIDTFEIGIFEDVLCSWSSVEMSRKFHIGEPS